MLVMINHQLTLNNLLVERAKATLDYSPAAAQYVLDIDRLIAAVNGRNTAIIQKTASQLGLSFLLVES